MLADTRSSANQKSQIQRHCKQTILTPLPTYTDLEGDSASRIYSNAVCALLASLLRISFMIIGDISGAEVQR